ncbi:cytochrome P450 [Patellaria atrata CBS 101060]|uniref:Cytochrome P450 n=1 Tax=Patellaria atrata CBS 101060 TaxID=1346257 RepID=A0A9P4S840_9PEZI|nr:cytochrome P450 [Patellaria atrata CBS 101060]
MTFTIEKTFVSYEDVNVELPSPWLLDHFVLSLLLPISLLVYYSYWTSNINRKPKVRRPFTVPYTVPILKSTFRFFFKGGDIFLYTARYLRDQAAVRLALFNQDIYLIHGAKNINEIFQNQQFTVVWAYGIALRSCFGMGRKAVSMYFNDTSGSRTKPIPGSNIAPHNRVGYKTHENILHGILGAGHVHAFNRYENAIFKELNGLEIGDEWVEYPDFTDFYHDSVGTCILRMLYGPTISEDPVFNRNLWKYDSWVMSLAKRLPRFLIPEAYRLRDYMLGALKNWHALAREGSKNAIYDREADSDPFWGRKMMRERHEMQLTIDNQDYDSIASAELAMVWASVANIVPSTMSLALHVFLDKPALADIRTSVASTVEPGERLKFDIRKLEKQNLLLSMYAETLRFTVQLHVPRCSPYEDVTIGGVSIPNGQAMVINTWLAHTDEDSWDTRNGAYPLTSFWGKRFLVDPKDPSSGPGHKKPKTAPSDTQSNEHYFSTYGLEGAWIPYGGGLNACPGRIIAKQIMLVSCAMMCTMFDVEILADAKALEFSTSRFGFGTRRPVGKVPFRIRRRQIPDFETDR